MVLPHRWASMVAALAYCVQGAVLAHWSLRLITARNPVPADTLTGPQLMVTSDLAVSACWSHHVIVSGREGHGSNHL